MTHALVPPPTNSPPSMADTQPKPPPEKSMLDQCEKRMIEVAGIQKQFHVLVVDRPELWPPASTFHTKYRMELPGGVQAINFPLKGVSLEDWDAIEAKYIIPTWNVPDEDPTPQYRQEREAALMKKYIAILELSTGKTVPGDSAELKYTWLKERGYADIETILNFILDALCGNVSGRVLDEYRNAMSSGKACSTIIEFTDFDDWKVASESKYVFRANRVLQDFIWEIPIKGISSSRKAEIENETQNPIAPMKPAQLPNGRFDPTNLMPDTNDPHWLKNIRAVEQKRTILYLDECLPFAIPGKNISERYHWLSQRLVGDVRSLRSFLDKELLSYRGRYDFLANTSYQNA